MLSFSVVIPAYNAEASIESTIRALTKQTLSLSEYEIIVVNDGSLDTTKERVQRLQTIIPNLVLINKVNGGVSSARNVGIRAARGKYILFLDADDSLTKNSMSAVRSFFDEHYDEIDIVCLNIKIKQTGKYHLRNKLLSTGVYNTEDTFATLSTVNVCVKNLFDNNKFFNESLHMHEDEEFSSRYVLEKGKFGYISEAIYIYDRGNNQSLTATMMNPYFSFEKSMDMYEGMCLSSIDTSGSVDGYIQNLILNDFGWKICSNVLIRNTKKHREDDLRRVSKILDFIDTKRILCHPMVDDWHKHFFISLKTNRPELVVGQDGIWLCDNQIRHQLKRNEVLITKIFDEAGKVKVQGFLKTFVTSHADFEKVSLYIKKKGELKKLKTTLSFYSYHRCKIKTNDFLKFEIEQMDESFSFYIEVEGYFFKINKVNCSLSAMKQQKRRHMYSWMGSNVIFEVNTKNAYCRFKKYDSQGVWTKLRKFWYGLKNFKIMDFILSLWPAISLYRDVVLYSDRDGVFDNSLDQFLFDLQKKDGVKRFYIYWRNEDYSVLVHKGVPKSCLIKKGSLGHKLAFLNAKVIMTSFIDANFYLPFSARRYKKYYSFKYHPKIFYLQHGCLHAKTIRYSAEFNSADYVVVSSLPEHKLWNSLGWPESALLKFGMPKFDLMNSRKYTKGQLRKILYVPSWRSYLATVDKNNKWHINSAKLKNSSFWLGLSDLFSQKFVDFLKNNSLELHIKPHPIFAQIIRNSENLSSEYVQFVQEINNDGYDLVVTDYSSIIFDFIYQGIPVMYYCPDIMEFEGGLNLYDEISTPMQDGFGPFATDVDGLMINIKQMMDLNFDTSVYSLRYDALFFNTKSRREAIHYEVLKLISDL